MALEVLLRIHGLDMSEGSCQVEPAGHIAAITTIYCESIPSTIMNPCIYYLSLSSWRVCSLIA